MWESSASSTDSDNNGSGELVESPDGSWYYGIEQFCEYAGVTKEELCEHFGDNFEYNVSLMLKNLNNREKGHSLLLAIPIYEISILSADRFKFALRHSEKTIQLYEAIQSDFELLGKIDERQYKLVIKQSSEIAKLVASGITFENLITLKLSFSRLTKLLSNVEGTLTIMKQENLTFETLAKLQTSQLNDKLIALNPEHSDRPSVSFFQPTSIKEESSTEASSSRTLKNN